MKPFWKPLRAPVRVFVAADRIRVLHLAGSPWSRRRDRRVRAVAAAGAERGAAMATELAAAIGASRGAAVEVLLSNELVRLAMVPQSDSRLTAEERRRLVEAVLVRAWGESAAEWEPRYCAAGGGALLAAAVARELLARIAEGVRAAGCRLKSIRPLSLHSLEHALAGLPRGESWVLVAEPRAAAIFLVDGKRIVHARIRPLEADAPESLAVALDREARLLGRPVGHVVVIGEGRIDAGVSAGWKVRIIPAADESLPPAGAPSALPAGC